MGKIFILTKIKIKIWRVTFLKVFYHKEIMGWISAFPEMTETSSEFDTYRLCEQRRFRRACASAQSHQNVHCSLTQAVSQEEPSDRKPDP